MEMVSAALPSASFKLLGVMPYAAKPSPVSTSLSAGLLSSGQWPHGGCLDQGGYRCTGEVLRLFLALLIKIP